MQKDYKNLLKMANDMGYKETSIITLNSDSHNSSGYLLGYVCEFKIWEIIKYYKVIIAYDLFDKPIYKYIRCNNTEIINNIDVNLILNEFLELL